MANHGFTKRFIEKRYFGLYNPNIKEWDLEQRRYNKKLYEWSYLCYVKASNAQIYKGQPISWWKARRAQHKALWNWLSKDPKRTKRQWPGWRKNGGRTPDNLDNCVACNISGLYCYDCPICWKTYPENGCCEFGSPYNFWRNTQGKVNAEEVRDLEWFFEREI